MMAGDLALLALLLGTGFVAMWAAFVAAVARSFEHLGAE